MQVRGVKLLINIISTDCTKLARRYIYQIIYIYTQNPTIAVAYTEMIRFLTITLISILIFYTFHKR